MKNIKPIIHIISLSFLLIILSCDTKKKSNNSTNAEFTGFEIVHVENSKSQKAIQKNDVGGVLQEGYILNGQKNGQWVTYQEDGRIETITSFVNGIKNGIYLKMTNRGQIEEKIYYQNDQYNGPYVKYRFGHPEEEMVYFDNKLDGLKRIYDKMGKIQQEIAYKEGVQHGIYKYFDTEGNVTLDYLYENGEKVRGGMVDKQE